MTPKQRIVFYAYGFRGLFLFYFTEVIFSYKMCLLLLESLAFNIIQRSCRRKNKVIRLLRFSFFGTGANSKQAGEWRPCQQICYLRKGSVLRELMALRILIASVGVLKCERTTAEDPWAFCEDLWPAQEESPAWAAPNTMFSRLKKLVRAPEPPAAQAAATAKVRITLIYLFIIMC